MGLLDKAKEKKQDEGAAPEPEASEEPVSTVEKTDTPQKKKKAGKKKPGAKPEGKKKPGLKSLGKKKPGMKSGLKKKTSPMKKKPARPKKEKVRKEPEEPAIEGLPEDLQFASYKDRFIGQLLDGVFFIIILIMIGLPLIVMADTIGFMIGILLWIILPFVYILMMEGKTGETFGKRTAHVKVISLDGRPLTPKKYLISALWKGIAFPFLSIVDFLIGFIIHKDENTRQRFSQYNSELIVIAIPKKKHKFATVSEEEVEDDEETEGDDVPSEETEESEI